MENGLVVVIVLTGGARGCSELIGEGVKSLEEPEGAPRAVKTIDKWGQTRKVVGLGRVGSRSPGAPREEGGVASP